MNEIAARWVTVYPKIATGFSTEVNSAVAKGANAGGKAVGVGMDQAVKSVAPKIGATFKSVMAPVLTLSAVAVVTGFVRKSVDAFNEFQDASSAASVTFGDSMSKVEAVTSKAAKTMGMSKTEATNAAITYGTFAKAAGLAGDEAANFSTDMVQLAADMASFRGTSPEQAIEAIGAAMRGESDPIEQYGVLLNDAMLRQEAMRLGIIKTTKEALTPQQRILAAQSAILAQTTQMQGDYNRTADQGGNVQKTLAAQSADLAVEIGEKLQPAIIEAQKAGMSMIEWAIDNQAVLLPLAKTVGIVGGAIAGMVAIAKGIEALKTARDTLTGMGDAFSTLGTRARVAGAGVAAGAGVLGIALAAAGAVYLTFADRNIKAQGAVDDFTAALEASNGVIDENVRKSAFKALQDLGAIDAAKQMGISLADLNAAALGNADAYDRVQASLEAWWPKAERASAWGWDSRWGQLQTINGALGRMTTEFDSQQESLTDWNFSASQTSTNVDKIATSTTNGRIAFEDYTKAINDTYNAQLALSGSQIALEAAIDDGANRIKEWTEDLQKEYEAEGKSEAQAKKLAEAKVDAAIKSGKALDINSEAGRKNRQALDQIASAGLSTVDSLKKAGSSSDDVGKTMDRTRKKFIETAKSMGATDDQIQDLIEHYGLIKSKDVDLNIKVKWKGNLSPKISVDGTGAGKITLRDSGGPMYPGQWYYSAVPELMKMNPGGGGTVYGPEQTKHMLSAAVNAQAAAPAAPSVTNIIQIDGKAIALSAEASRLVGLLVEELVAAPALAKVGG